MLGLFSFRASIREGGIGLTRPLLCITRSAGSGEGWPWLATRTESLGVRTDSGGPGGPFWEWSPCFFDRLEILQQLWSRGPKFLSAWQGLVIGLILCDTLLAPFPVIPNGIYLLFIQKLVNLNKHWGVHWDNLCYSGCGKTASKNCCSRDWKLKH